MSKARYNAYKFIARTISPYITGDEVATWLKKSKPIDWEQVADISASHSIVQALYPAFVEKELITYIADDFLSYAEQMHGLNCKRNEMLRKQLIDAVLVVNKLGMQPLLMKGAAHLFLNTFSNEGDRLLTDLDILVPFGEVESIGNAFLSKGYEYQDEKMHFIQTHHHYPPLVKYGECATIELHRDLMFREQQYLFPTELAWESAVDISLPNSAQAKVLNPNYRLLHSFIHSCLVDHLYQSGYAELRQLHELVSSCFVYSSEIDWQEISGYAQKQNIAKQWFTNLFLANKLMHMPSLENNKHGFNSNCQYTRVRSKLRYGWFENLDTRISRYIRRHRSKTMSSSQESA